VSPDAESFVDSVEFLIVNVVIELGRVELVMCWLGLEATGHAWLGLAQARPGQAKCLAWLAPGLGLGFCKPEAMAQAMAWIDIQSQSSQS
jgi:hypothetical protein